METPFGSTFTLTRVSLSISDGVILGLLIYLICRAFFVKRKKRKFSRELYIALLFAYVGALVSLTIPIILPMGWRPDAASARFILSSINFSPLQSTLQILHNALSHNNIKEFFRVCGGNFIMLMPLGILAPLINKKFHFLRVLILGLCVSVSIELLQLLSGILYGSMIRTVEIDDVILNTLGCIIAYLIFAGVRRIFKKR